jgi:hypothetical protein
MRISDQQTYFALTASLLRLGLVPFPISPRNSEAAVKHLLKETGAAAAILASGVELDGEALAVLKTMKAPTFWTLYEGGASEKPMPIGKTPDMESVAMILHSSGRLP